MDYAAIALKLVIGFLSLWLVTRILGKKEISQLTPFDFVSSLTLSEIIGNTIYQKEVHFYEMVFAFAAWAVLSFIFEWITEQVKSMRGTLDGKPAILIREGKIDREQMRRNRLDFEQLRMLLRMQSVFSLQEVWYAVFEANGALTVMKKAAYEAAQNRNLNIPAKEKSLPFLLVEDGSIRHDALRKCGKTEEWLIEQLQKQGFGDYRKVLYAEWTPEEGLFAANEEP